MRSGAVIANSTAETARQSCRRLVILENRMPRTVHLNRRETPSVMLSRSPSLLQRGVNRGELGVQGGAEAVDRGNNRNRNAGRDQAVFNGGSARFVIQETRKKFGHIKAPVREGSTMTANNCSRVKSTAKKLRKNPGRESGGVICGMLTIDAAIHDAVMALPPDERRDRAKVNEAARDGL